MLRLDKHLLNHSICLCTFVKLKRKSYFLKSWHIVGSYFLSLHFLQERNNRLRKSRDLSASHTDLARWRFFFPTVAEVADGLLRGHGGHENPLPVHILQTHLTVNTFISSIIRQHHTTKCSLHRFHCTFEGLCCERGIYCFSVHIEEHEEYLSVCIFSVYICFLYVRVLYVSVCWCEYFAFSNQSLFKYLTFC